MKAVKIIVKGLVQGVGFRYTTKMLADELKIKGKVVNMPDKALTKLLWNNLLPGWNLLLLRQDVLMRWKFQK